jgi:hypothetical protein
MIKAGTIALLLSLFAIHFMQEKLCTDSTEEGLCWIGGRIIKAGVHVP